MRFLIILMAINAIFLSCKQNQEIVARVAPIQSLDTIAESNVRIQPLYQQTPPIVWQLIHTNLDVSFDIPAQRLMGEAVITLSPYFYKQNTLELDAKSFIIDEINVFTRKDTLNQVSFDYDDKKVKIKLDRFYSREDTIKIQMTYTADPTSITDGGGKAITGAQGLYFVNPQKKEKGMPVQIWTQGETEYSSCWFPTLDEPNQKTTQEIAITVPEKYTTLSNGLLEFSTENGNGTRTDYWVQNKAHSPYLAMMAIGEFAVVRNEWQGKEVSYFVEPQYEKDAPFIFKNTAEMLQYYSDITGVDFPWDKYSQVVVRNFVSGAMENTSATLHGEFVQRHKRELIDYNPEGVIAHELFHQWFGDMVSCESWANLPLNEAFATYGEFLWKEHKYGQDEADYHLMNNLNGYLNESKYKREEWVRFDYESKDDMFDGHTYSKGARILHMLRTYAGDEAFFKALNIYLTRYAFGSAEMHQLRLIFEEVTGQDYNWFFDQWAYRSGHPTLTVESKFDTASANLQVIISQEHDLDFHPLYQIPFSLEVHSPSGINRYELWLKDEVSEFNFKLGSAPYLVDFDSEKYILCEKNEIKTEQEWIYQYQNCKKFLARYEAIRALGKHEKLSNSGREVLYDALSDKHYAIRELALNHVPDIEMGGAERCRNKLEEMSFSDSKSSTRAKALNWLITEFESDNFMPFAEKALADSSYRVVSTALALISKYDSVKALVYSGQLEKLQNKELQFQIATIYSNYGNESKMGFFRTLQSQTSGSDKVRLIYPLKNYVLRVKNDEISTEALQIFSGIEQSSPFIWVRRSAVDAMVEVEDMYLTEKAALEEEKLAEEGNGQAQIRIRKRLEKVNFMLDFIDAKFKELEKTETDKQILDAIFKETSK